MERILILCLSLGSQVRDKTIKLQFIPTPLSSCDTTSVAKRKFTAFSLSLNATPTLKLQFAPAGNEKLTDDSDYVDITTSTSGYYYNSTLEMTDNWYTFSREIKCRADWDTPSNALQAFGYSDLNAVGSYMDSQSFSNGDNNGVMDCIVWGDDAPYSVSWSQDGSALETVADTVRHYI